MATIEKVDIGVRLAELIAQKYDQRGIYLVEVLLHGRKIEVICDSDTGLTIDDCTGITRYLQFHIDHENMFEGNYTLEVSSPGLERPLKLPRQFKKNVGRPVSVKTHDAKYQGRLVMVDAHGVMIKLAADNPKKANDTPLMRFEWSELIATKVLPVTNKQLDQ
jgi:ribosome maturation factor RimP